MTRKVFSEEEQQLLRRNPYTLKVSLRQLCFTKEFKTEFKKRCDLSALPRKSLAAQGYDQKVARDYRMNSLTVFRIESRLCCARRGVHRRTHAGFPGIDLCG